MARPSDLKGKSGSFGSGGLPGPKNTLSLNPAPSFKLDGKKSNASAHPESGPVAHKPNAKPVPGSDKSAVSRRPKV